MFELVTDAAAMSSIARYAMAYDAMARRDPVAFALFRDLRRRFADDPLIAYHEERLSDGEVGALVKMVEK